MFNHRERYLDHLDFVNNWDLVDSSAHKILGHYLLDKPRDILYQFAKTQHLWRQRVAIIATFAFIANNDFKDSLQLAVTLMKHPHHHHP